MQNINLELLCLKWVVDIPKLVFLIEPHQAFKVELYVSSSFTDVRATSLCLLWSNASQSEAGHELSNRLSKAPFKGKWKVIQVCWKYQATAQAEVKWRFLWSSLCGDSLRRGLRDNEHTFTPLHFTLMLWAVLTFVFLNVTVKNKSCF